MAGGSVSESFLVPRLVDTEGLLMGFFFFGGPHFFPPTLPKIPCVLCNVRLWALHLFQSGAGWRLSENNYAKLLSGSITKYILSIVRDW